MGAALAGGSTPARLAHEARLLVHVAAFEMTKASAFRAGFIVREILRGVSRPAVMILVYAAMMRATGSGTLGTWTLTALVHYLVLSATLQRVVMDERSLDLGDQIFEGRITKFLVMPTPYFTLLLGRLVQHTALQLAFALVFFAAGAVLLPRHWPVPASSLACVQALALVLLGAYCQFLVYVTMNSLAFWLQQVWSLLAMVRFVGNFASGVLIPISLMPEGLARCLELLYPYWMLSAPVEILLGRLGSDAFARGVLLLLPTALILQAVAAVTWRLGLRRYAGEGA